jgi:GNAT superfamily N-acetyltransferase
VTAESFAIRIAEGAEEIARCYPVMRELRQHISSVEEFIGRVQLQEREGYLLAYLEAGGEIRAAAGYRFQEMLYYGRLLYVDDLVTREADRSAGYGGKLFDWLVQQARERGCEHFELDSGVQRFDAHRFYLMKRMKSRVASFLVAAPLKPGAGSGRVVMLQISPSPHRRSEHSAEVATQQHRTVASVIPTEVKIPA